MSDVYTALAQRIRQEMIELDRIVNRIAYLWPKITRLTIDQEVYVDSVALNLHSFYSGVEKLFELIVRQFDTLPTGKDWHKTLLEQVTESTTIRPAIIGPECAQQLDEFRRFRHLVRNVYSTNLQPEKMSDLIETLPILWNDLAAELCAFADFLEKLTR